MSSTPTKQIDGEVAIGRGASIGGNARIRGSATVGHNLRVDGWLDAPNIKGPNKGLFRTGGELKSAYPHPREGWWALVGDTLPAQVYIAHGGSWYAQTNEDGSAKTAGNPTIESTYLTEEVEKLGEDVDELKRRVGETETEIGELQSGQRIQDGKIGQIETEAQAAQKRADEANEKADNATKAANGAIETAESALVAAQAAQSIAEHADNTAEAAKTVAGAAKNVAEAAKTVAGAAKAAADAAVADAAKSAQRVAGVAILPIGATSHLVLGGGAPEGVYFNTLTGMFEGDADGTGYTLADYAEPYTEGEGATAQLKFRARTDCLYRCGTELYRIKEGRLIKLHQDELEALDGRLSKAEAIASEGKTVATRTAGRLAGLRILPVDGIGIVGDDIFPSETPGFYWDTEDREFIGQPDVNGYEQEDYFVQDAEGDWVPRTDCIYSCGGALYHIVDGQMVPLHQADLDALAARVTTAEKRLAGTAILPIDATVNLGTVAGAQQEGIRFDTRAGAFVGDFAAAGYAEEDYNEKYSESELVLPRWRARRDRIYRCGTELYVMEGDKLVKLHAGELAALRTRVTAAEDTLASLEVAAENIQEAVDTVYERVEGAGILPFDARYPLLGGKGVWFDSQNGKFAGDFSAHGYGEDAYNDKTEPEEGSLLPPERHAREDVIFRCGAELYRVEDGELVRLFQGGSASVPGEADRITEDEIDALICN